MVDSGPVISFWQRGFGHDASWDVTGVPSGDYRIILRRVGEDWPEWSSEDDRFWQTCRMGEIVFFATPYTWVHLDERVVRALLDIHTALFPTANHPSVHALIRDQYRAGEYLRSLGEDLQEAVKCRRVRIERFERPWPFPEKDEKPPSKRQPVAERALCSLSPAHKHRPTA